MKFIVGRVRDAGAINVGRPTALGNPFVMRVESDRDTVCDKYEQWFAYQIMLKTPKVMSQLCEIWRQSKGKEHVVLGCYCSPRRCHAETIARYLNHYSELK